MSIGANIKKIREKNNLTQKELAKIVGVTDKAVSLWEQDRRDPRMGPMQKMSDYFGIKLSELMGESTADNTPPPIAVTVPIINYLPEDGSVINPESFMGSEVVSPEIIGNNKDVVFYKAENNKYFPLFSEGDLLLINFTNTVKSGSLVLVSIEDQPPIIKRLYFADNQVLLRGRTNLCDLRFEGEDLKKLKVLGRILRIIKNY